MLVFKNKSVVYFLSILLVLNFVLACNEKSEQVAPEVLKISFQQGLSSFENESRAIFLLQQYLESELNIKIELVAIKDYQDQLNKFHAGDLDLALFGGYSFIKARESDEADPLVMRDVDFKFFSYFIVNRNNKAANVSDLAGQSFSFGNKLSTSGHIMPRFFLATQGIIPETFFSKVVYTPTHEETALAIEAGVYDVGVVNAFLIDNMFDQNKLNRENIRILWKTPTFPDYVWVARNALPESLKLKIIEAFLKLSTANPQHGLLLDAIGAGYYLPANCDDFEPIEKIVTQLNNKPSNES